MLCARFGVLCVVLCFVLRYSVLCAVLCSAYCSMLCCALCTVLCVLGQEHSEFLMLEVDGLLVSHMCILCLTYAVGLFCPT